MNRHCYRIIFNAIRNQMMVVPDIAVSRGKSCSNSTDAVKFSGTRHFQQRQPLIYSTLSLALYLVFSAMPSFAAIIADPTAPGTQRPTILQDAAGNPLVNIQTPSAAGVSRNTYQQFDVQSNGVTLNNARSSNPWLATGEARVILNEVNSSNPSYLGGAITVNGARAQVVIANPSGITVDGASFVNASRATLTTGMPIVNNGQLDALNITRGLITVSGKGLDARATNYTEILSRAAAITGRIDANDLNVTTGAQTVDYATGQITAAAGVGISPTLAIDTNQLGGMYAGRITLLSTEAGVGVRNAGSLAAGGGALIVTADGKLENSGTMNAAITSLATVQGNIDNSGVLQGDQVLMLASGGDINLSGKGMSQNPASASTMMLNANGAVNLASGTMVSSSGAGGQVTLGAGGAVNFGAFSNIIADGNIQISSDGQINTQNTTLQSTSADVSVLSAQGINLGKSNVLGKRVHIETGAPFIETNAPIYIEGSDISGADQTTLIATGDVSLVAAIMNAGKLHIESAKTIGLNDARLTATNTATLVGSGMTMTGGAIQANGTGVAIDILATQTDIHAVGGDLKTPNGDINISAVGNLSLSGTNIDSGAATRLTALGNINLGNSTQSGSNTTTRSGSNCVVFWWGRCFFQDRWVDNVTTQYINAIPTKINAGNINITAGSDLNLYGTQINAVQGSANLSAGKATNYHSVTSQSTTQTTRFSDRYFVDTYWIGRTTSLSTVTHPALITGTAVTASADINVNTGGNLGLHDATRFNASRDLSLQAGTGNLTFTANNQAMLKTGRDLNLVAKTGALTLAGSNGTTPAGSNRVNFTGLRDINLQAGKMDLQGSVLGASRNITLTSTTGDIWLNALGHTIAEGTYTLAPVAAPLPLPYRASWIQRIQYNLALASYNAYLASYRVDNNTYADPVTLSAGSALTVTSARDIQAQGLNAYGGISTTMQSAGNISLDGTVNSITRGYSALPNGNSELRLINQNRIASGGKIDISAAGGNLDLNAVQIDSQRDEVRLTALADVNLLSAANWENNTGSSSSSSCNWWGRCTTTNVYYRHEYLTTIPSAVTGQSINITAGNNLNIYGAALTSWGGRTDLAAGNAANYYAVDDQTNIRNTVNSSSSWLGIINLGRSSGVSTSFTNIPLVTRLIAQGALTSSSGANTLLQGTYVNAAGGATFRAGVGATAKADAKIILEGVKTTVQTAQTRESNYVLWQKQSGSGNTSETFALPSFVGNTTFTAPGGLVVQIADGSPLKTQIQTLASQPGMGYLNDLAARSDVNWQPVKLAFDQWSYQQQGLTPAGAALVAVAVAWATGGMGAELLGTTGSTTSLMANAAFTSLAAQASITLINNQGNLGKTLRDLASSNTAKAALTAVLTAGVMDKIGAMPGMKTLSNGTAFSDKLTFNLINATGRALTNAAINGGSLESALQDALVSGLVDTAQGAASSKIKLLEDDYVIHKLAHALAGCVAGAAAGGACQDGAIGAAVGEMVAQLFADTKPGAYATQAEWDAYNNKVLSISKLAAGGISAYTGGNAQTAITTAEVAVRNNALKLISRPLNN
ncbi:MAG: DUF637 domain-containing protein, partial [Gallionella sp.]|nr:DUF637 domain-containing protein [Gallionella sp.]